MKVNPFYSSETKNVYHVCNKCTEGNNIETKNKKSGTGGLPMCKNCKDRIANGTC